MISFEEALQRVLDAAVVRGRERVPLRAAASRVLAQDVGADSDMPPFNKSAMDGYACRREDLGAALRVVDFVPAGARPKVRRITRGECVKIMTGAIVPGGADCVVMVEHVAADADGTIRFTGGDTAENICHKGEDVHAGDVVLRAGTLLKPQHIAVLAALGCARPEVYQQPRLGIIATGSELVSPARRAVGAKIRDSNSHQLAAQAAQIGLLAKNYGIVKDDQASISACIGAAMAEQDVLLISGGVSVGDLDLVPDVLKALGFTFLFQTVAMKPGRPTVFWHDCRRHVLLRPAWKPSVHLRRF